MYFHTECADITGAVASDDITLSRSLRRIAYNVDCLGSESNIMSCSLQEFDDQGTCGDAGIVCHGKFLFLPIAMWLLKTITKFSSLYYKCSI